MNYCLWDVEKRKKGGNATEKAARKRIELDKKQRRKIVNNEFNNLGSLLFSEPQEIKRKLVITLKSIYEMLQ